MKNDSINLYYKVSPNKLYQAYKTKQKSLDQQLKLWKLETNCSKKIKREDF